MQYYISSEVTESMKSIKDVVDENKIILIMAAFGLVIVVICLIAPYTPWGI
jgi:hypothetical protein